MKQKLIISALCVLALAACTGKQNKNGDAAKNTDTESVAGNKNAAGNAQFAKNKCLTPIFLLANSDGSKFLLKDNEATDNNVPDSLKNYKYILYNGKYYNVDFKGVQQGNRDADNGRDTPYNFDNCHGWLFAMQSGKLLNKPKDEYDMFWDKPLLVDEAFKAGTNLLKIKKFIADDNPGDISDMKTKFEKQYGKKTIKFKLDALVDDYKYFVMQFETVDNKALGAIALVSADGKAIVKDFPSDWNEISTWREGDEGEFFGFDIDFATIENGRLTLYTYSASEEGETRNSYVVEGNEIVQGSVSNYFYHAPD